MTTPGSKPSPSEAQASDLHTVQGIRFSRSDLQHSVALRLALLCPVASALQSVCLKLANRPYLLHETIGLGPFLFQEFMKLHKSKDKTLVLRNLQSCWGGAIGTLVEHQPAKGEYVPASEW